MEARMTVCNMSIEWGAKAGLIAPDQTTFDYIEGRPEAPKGDDWDAAVEHWTTLRTDDDAEFDREIVLDASTMTPFVTWGTNPGQGVAAGRRVPSPDDFEDEPATGSPPRRRWTTWASRPAPRCARSRSTPSSSAPAPTAGSRTCASRPRSSRAATSTADTRLLVVPGSVRVRLQAEDEGLDVVFKEAGARVARGGLLDVPGHEPRPARARASAAPRPPTATSRAGRARAAAPTWSPCPSPPPPRCAAPSPSPADLDARSEPAPWTRSPPTPASACRCGAATSTPTRSSPPSTSSGSRAPASRTASSPPGAATRLRAQPADVRRRLRARRGPRLRHRLLARARRVGAAELRLPGRDLLPLRRHLPRQLRQGRAARGAGRREGRAAAVGPARGPARAPDHRRPRGAHGPRRRGPRTRSRTPSTSTTTPGGGCSRGSTTSASRWARGRHRRLRGDPARAGSRSTLEPSSRA